MSLRPNVGHMMRIGDRGRIRLPGDDVTKVEGLQESEHGLPIHSHDAHSAGTGAAHSAIPRLALWIAMPALLLV